MKRALIVIDYTYDFVADEGKLTCGKAGQALDGYIAETIRSFVKNGDIVVFAVDVHDLNDPYHPETKLFPPHNIRGTTGRALYGEVGQVFASLLEQGTDTPTRGASPSNEISLPDNVRFMDKSRYSSFAGTDLEIFLRSHGTEELHLVGVCTDICVLHTAVDAYNKGFNIVVHEQGVASFSDSGHDWALKHFTGSLGATVLAK